MSKAIKRPTQWGSSSWLLKNGSNSRRVPSVCSVTSGLWWIGVLTMEYKNKSFLLITIFLSKFLLSKGITRNSPNWEQGLKEAVLQTLLRQRNNHPHLRDNLMSAPLLATRQSRSVAFGDVVILARGQLFSTPNGYRFIQDPYQNDCPDCHDRRPCHQNECEVYRSRGPDKLMALWTVKRIRHRDANRFDLEYKVSPVSAAYVTRRGSFDYAVPGHVFVVRSGAKVQHNDKPSAYLPPREYYATPAIVATQATRFPFNHHRPNLQYLPQDHHQDKPHYHQEKPHYHPQQKPHYHPHYHPQEKPDYHQHEKPHYHTKPTFPTLTTAHDYRQQEIDLYKELLNSLSQKTSTTKFISIPTDHRFGPPTKSTTPITHSTLKTTQSTAVHTQPFVFVPLTQPGFTPIDLPSGTKPPEKTTIFVPASEVTEAKPIFDKVTPYVETTKQTLFDTKHTSPYTTTKETTPYIITTTKETTPYVITTTKGTSPFLTSKDTTPYITYTTNESPKQTYFVTTSKQTTPYKITTSESPKQTYFVTTSKQTTPYKITTSESPKQTYFVTTSKQTTPYKIESTKQTPYLTTKHDAHTTYSYTHPPTTKFSSNIPHITTEQLYTIAGVPPPTTHFTTTNFETKPHPTFFIDSTHEGYPKTTPTTPFTDKYDFTDHTTKPDYVQYTEPGYTVGSTKPTHVGTTILNLPGDRYDPDSTPHFIQLPEKTPEPSTPFRPQPTNPTYTTSGDEEEEDEIKKTTKPKPKPTKPIFIPEANEDTEEDIELFPAQMTTVPPETTTPKPKPTEGFGLFDDAINPIPEANEDTDEDIELFPAQMTTVPPETTTTPKPKPTKGFLLFDDEYYPGKKNTISDADIKRFEMEFATRKPEDVEIIKPQVINSVIKEVFDKNVTMRPTVSIDDFDDLFGQTFHGVLLNTQPYKPKETSDKKTTVPMENGVKFTKSMKKKVTPNRIQVAGRNTSRRMPFGHKLTTQPMDVKRSTTFSPEVDSTLGPTSENYTKYLDSTAQTETFNYKETTNKPESTTTPIKIIYSDFYVASTAKSHPTNLEGFTESTLRTVEMTTPTFIMTQPSTSQSFSTSLSVEVNKHNRSDNQRVINRGRIRRVKIVTTPVPMEDNLNAESKSGNSLDHLTLSLVNHARSIDYLENNKARSVKYKRRNYGRIRKVKKWNGAE